MSFNSDLYRMQFDNVAPLTCSPIVGFECLHCMGFPWWLIVSNGNYKCLTHDQAMELAGNAFNAYMFAAYASLPKS